MAPLKTVFSNCSTDCAVQVTPSNVSLTTVSSLLSRATSRALASDSLYSVTTGMLGYSLSMHDDVHVYHARSVTAVTLQRKLKFLNYCMEVMKIL